MLMGADILLFNAHKVPVGRDQIQHIEMARDMAASFNHLYGEHFVLPEAAVDDQVATLPGLDGRKMSKSYDNTIPLFCSREQLRKLIQGIVTDSRAPGEPKDTEGSALFQIYQAFATPEQTEALRQAYAAGIAWGDAKQQLFEHVDGIVAPLRERYEALIQDPARIEATLLAGAQRAREMATPFLRELRAAVGLRSLAQGSSNAKTAKAAKTALPAFKQYREKDGLFYFKMTNARGDVLLQSKGYANPRDAAAAIAHLKSHGAAAVDTLAEQIEPPQDGMLHAVRRALDVLLTLQE
jgi:tryptophanyl-tRNA synthetase